MGIAGGKGGGSGALAAKPNILNSLQIQTSSYGQVVPILYGQNRVAGRLIWAGDFAAIPHTSSTKVGGKGLGAGGGNAVSNTTYTYQTAIAIALCSGPIQNIHNVWDTKGKLTLVSTSVTVPVPSGGGPVTIAPPGGVFHSPIGVSRADAFSVANNDFGSDGLATLTGTQDTPMVQVAGSPAAGQYSLSGGTFTFSAADAGQQVTINYVYSVPDSNSNGQPQQKLNLTLFTGSRPQSPWSYLTSAHPGQDLGYNGVAYVASSAMDLGESGTLPNMSFEVLGLLPFGGAITDAEPSAIIGDLVNNQFYGLAGALPLGDLTAYRNWCTANGVFLSPVLDAQKTAAEWIQDILDITNAAAVWSEGVLKIVSYGDTTAVGNGATFLPNTQPIYDLTTSDLLTQVVIKRPSVAEVMNDISVEFLNRTNDYNTDVSEDKDDAMIAVYGLRKADPKQAHSITTATVAKFVANLLRKRSVEIRATYTFTLGWQFNLLEPMDLVTLTVPELGYSKKPVRITAMREDDSGQIEIDAEDFPWGTAAPTLYAHQPSAGAVAQANSDPGSVSTPIIFEANDRLSLTGNYEVWLGVCGPTVAIIDATNTVPIVINAASHGFKTGQKVNISGVGGNTAANGNWVVTLVDPDHFTLNGSNGAIAGAFTSGGLAINQDWGGCSVWVSPDNVNYVKVGRMYGASRMGALTAQLVSAADPDTTHTLAVDLTASQGMLLSGSKSDCDNFRTLCCVDGELISYEDATLTSAFHYDLGAHGTPLTITGATNASPIKITAASHGLGTGETVVISGVVGNTAANGTWQITVLDASNFNLIGSTGSGAYVSGGTVSVAALLHRGVFGSPITTHNIGSQFLRLDDAVFVWEADPTLVGTTIYFKFTSFNTYGLMEQSLAGPPGNPLPAYSFNFNGLYGNLGHKPANNATLDSAFISGSAASITIHGPGTGGSYTAWKQDQSTRTVNQQTLTLDNFGTAIQVNTIYYVTYDFNAQKHTAWINYSDYIQAIGRGQIDLGGLQTVMASGTGGTAGGGGVGHGGTGGGAPNRFA